eukprot:1119290-Alexandrium_andersonii.AAC.1
MSASLVGSEMCIRDSGEPQRAGTLPPPREQRRPLRSRGVRRAVGLGAVSYTHLTLPTICSV